MRHYYKGMGQTLESIMAPEEDAEKLKLEGWRTEFRESVAVAHEPKTENQEVSLKATAELLGIKVDGRWSDKRIQEEIERANSTAVDNESISTP